MDIKSEINNAYWFKTSSLLHEYVDIFYENSYTPNGLTPIDANGELEKEQLQALINIISEATSIIEGSGKKVEIVIKDE